MPPAKKTTKKSTTKKTTKTTTKKPAAKKATTKKSTTKKTTKKATTKKVTKKTTAKKPTTKKTTKKAASASTTKKTTRKRTTKKAPANLVAQVAEPEVVEAEAQTEAQMEETGESKPSRGRRSVPDLRARKSEQESRRPRRSRRDEEASDSDRQDPGEAASNDAPKPRTDGKKGKKDPRWEEIFSGSAFGDLNLRGSILKALHRAGFKSPTRIQAELIPLVLDGKDVLGQSRTGSGKTAAFGIPLINNAIRGLAFQSIILAPTRELAIQITDELEMFAKYTPIKLATVYGGQKIDTQAKKLAGNPEIIVATPGRMMDMMERRFIHLKNVRHVVLDEVDRMLDIGFRDDIKHILSRVKSKQHQTVFVSATISPEIETLSRSFMRDGETERLETVGGSLTVALVEQQYYAVNPWDKSRLLVHTIKNEKPELAVVFCRMKRTVDKIAGRLTDAGVEAEAIHGDLPQTKRTRIMKRLKEGKLHVLVASDLAARGIDVDGITHVINFDLPEDPEIYVHRIGRTARAGRGGTAFSFVTPEQGPLLTEIEKLTNVHIAEIEAKGFRPGPVPQDIVEERKRDVERQENLKSKNRYANSKPKVPKTEKTVDASRFPGGVVPTKLPPKMLRGKMKTARAIEQEAAKELASKND